MTDYRQQTNDFNRDINAFMKEKNSLVKCDS
jgi:hypothetical protein